MSSKSEPKRGEDFEFDDEPADRGDRPRRRHVDPDEREEYEEWRRERSGRGRKRRRDREHPSDRDDPDY